VKFWARTKDGIFTIYALESSEYIFKNIIDDTHDVFPNTA
jgi:hypothetical protein